MLLASVLAPWAMSCTPWTCDAETCFDGCCAADGVCRVQSLGNVCGLGGQACVTCEAGTSCVSGKCVKDPCSAQNCMGCCSNGECVTGTSRTQCGSNGAACENCTTAGFDSICGRTGTVSRCASCRDVCKGCCSDNGECFPGTSSAACGVGGEQCFECRSGYSCRQDIFDAVCR